MKKIKFIPSPHIEFTMDMINQLRSEKGWTDLRRAYVVKLYQDGGFSCSQIASKLGGDITRNAVIGALHRMGCANKGRMPPNRRATRKRDMIAAKRIRLKNKTTKVVKLPVPWREPRADFHPMSTAPAVEVPTDKKVTLLQLEDHHCRFPLGPVNDKAEHFCGQDRAAGVSVCLGHARVCFQPPRPRGHVNGVAKGFIFAAGGRSSVDGGKGGQNQQAAAGDALEAAE